VTGEKRILIRAPKWTNVNFGLNIEAELVGVKFIGIRSLNFFKDLYF